MAYNLQPLITILEQILNPQPPRWNFDHDKPKLESLLEKAESLLQILESSSLTKIASLESRIRDAAHKAEDIIESHMVDQMLSTPEGVRMTFSTPDLQQVMLELDSAMEQVVKLMEEKAMSTGSSSSIGANVQQATQELESVKLVEVEGNKKGLVGVDADLLQLKDRLTNSERHLEIIPIVGMGGVGKTTLAQNLYDDPLIVYHFHYRGWAAISQDYNMREVLLNLLRRPNEKLNHELVGCTESELKQKLYQRLFGRRYLIILDDVWSTKFWDAIRSYLPDTNNGSRVVITTRESDVAKYPNSKSKQHDVQLLNDSASWDLLRQIVFGEKDCPRELQGIGTKIASDCDGLPLAIQAIGGLLSKAERSRDVWEHISTDVKGALVESDKQVFNILSLSYDHLPIHLKLCFLYMGAFPEDSSIKGSRLVYYWIVEGFVKSNGDKSLEEQAEDYLKALVERNLLFVSRKRSNGKPKSYSLHDLLRDLRIRKANEEKSLHVKNSMRYVSVHSSSEMEDVCASTQLMSLTRSFISTDDKILSRIFLKTRLLRVLSVMSIVFMGFPREILELVNLRFLGISCACLPSGISRLSNLQTLICRQDAPYYLSDILEISELRYLNLGKFILFQKGYKIKFVLTNLQKLYGVWITYTLIESGFFEMIPNIIGLGIYYEDSLGFKVDLSHLHKLQTLKCYSNLEFVGSLHKLKIPCNLRKLTLGQFEISGSFLTTLCALPNLEVLQIVDCYFESGEDHETWEMTEGDEFRSLQVLYLERLQVRRWRPDETTFPRLRKLIIYKCYDLEEIPDGIGDIPTLQEIYIQECSAAVEASAKEFQKVQQEEYDNYDLKVIVY